MAKKTLEIYQGFEQGPIRPPSEAYSLLIRITRNCPWNHCTFCPVYNNEAFTIRPVEHVIKDIDMIHKFVDVLRRNADSSGQVDRSKIDKIADRSQPGEVQALNATLHWAAAGMSSIFLQDANSLIMKPVELVEILTHLKKCFPWVDRITSYARSHTIARIKDEDLIKIKEAGLTRIHMGLESGSDEVLKMVKKGVTKEVQIKAGKKAKKAGMELSEYVMPGLGGKKLSKIHAIETADALNNINPDFIRLRTLALPSNIELYKDYKEGNFEKCTDLMMAEEVLLFLEHLDGITSTIKSDHILNLFEEVEGVLPGDKDKMISIVKTFLSMEPDRQMIYQVGRRMGIMSRLNDMNNTHLLEEVQRACLQYGITPDNVDETIDQLMTRFL
ncbi:MAG: radical SAM protein [Desulfobacterales bacterium]|jgi:hypothetical protein|nr:radical SAM protein [Desulfobacteraceae bacterium]MBT7085468.1 radical SAM protein [Desulfobacterales bacterium]MBT7696108.1 radical SAM protein [Desulfobacterales bacterium]